MTEIKPRYEFRLFGPHLEWLWEKVQNLASFDRFRESREVYIISAKTNEYNTKIRAGVLDIKKLLQKKEALEQWAPVLKENFPLKKELLVEKIIPAFSATGMKVEMDQYRLKEFFKYLIQPSADMHKAEVMKRRFGYRYGDCIIEVAEVYINGARMVTVCFESENADTVDDLRDKLGLKQEENVNYLIAVKRVLGLYPLADGSVYNVLKHVNED